MIANHEDTTTPGLGSTSGISSGDLSLDLLARAVQVGNQKIELSRREISLLRVLMSEPNRIFSREDLCKIVWRRRHSRGMKIVEVSIGRLRRKIGRPDLIQTVRHQGYTLRSIG